MSKVSLLTTSLVLNGTNWLISKDLLPPLGRPVQKEGAGRKVGARKNGAEDEENNRMIDFSQFEILPSYMSLKQLFGECG